MSNLLPQPELWFELDIKRANGATEHYEQRSESYLIAFLQHVRQAFIGLSGQPNEVVVATDNTSSNLGTWVGNGQQFMSALGLLSLDQGVMLGTGNTTVSLSDYKLQTIIPHGTGAGQLERINHTLGAVSGSNPIRTFYLNKEYMNTGGGLITVREAGVYVFTTSPNRFYCIVRDVLVAPVNLNTGDGAVATYTFRITT